jgi:hypothetical protein
VRRGRVFQGTPSDQFFTSRSNLSDVLPSKFESHRRKPGSCPRGTTSVFRKLQSQTMIPHVRGENVGRRKRQTSKTQIPCRKIAASSCGGTTSSWAKVQSPGFLSIRHLRNCAMCRKRSPCIGRIGGFTGRSTPNSIRVRFCEWHRTLPLQPRAAIHSETAIQQGRLHSQNEHSLRRFAPVSAVTGPDSTQQSS